MDALQTLKDKLKVGRVYRRSDLEIWSNAVDRHLAVLLDECVLIKLASGLYYYPKKTSFGVVPPDDHVLVKAFLKDDRFLITTPNSYNSLGLNTTQLYNQVIVYNHKRHGKFKLGKRSFDFRVKPSFPNELSPEFLLVDVANNLSKLAESFDNLQNRLVQKAYDMDQSKLKEYAYHFGTVRTKKLFTENRIEP
jgi:hypothetical protein